MGSGQSSDFSSQLSEHKKFVLVGLDAAGKTTMIYKMGWGPRVTTVMITIGLNLETTSLSKADLVTWDIGGGDKIRALWEHFTLGASGLIWVLDAHDRDRFGESRDELFRFFNGQSYSEMAQKATSRTNPLPVLIFLNKQDLTNSMSTVEFLEWFDLVEKFREFGVRNWTVQPCVATTGEGLEEGFAWLAAHTYSAESENVPSSDGDEGESPGSDQIS